MKVIVIPEDKIDIINQIKNSKTAVVVLRNGDDKSTPFITENLVDIFPEIKQIIDINNKIDYVIPPSKYKNE